MKAINFTVRYSFNLKTEYDKMIAIIIYLQNDNVQRQLYKINKTTIKDELKRCVDITGFDEDTSFFTTLGNVGYLNFDYEEDQEVIDSIVLKAVNTYNLIYKQDIKLTDLEY